MAGSLLQMKWFAWNAVPSHVWLYPGCPGHSTKTLMSFRSRFETHACVFQYIHQEILFCLNGIDDHLEIWSLQGLPKLRGHLKSPTGTESSSWILLSSRKHLRRLVPPTTHNPGITTQMFRRQVQCNFGRASLDSNSQWYIERTTPSLLASSVFKDLGVTLDQEYTFAPHIQRLCRDFYYQSR